MQREGERGQLGTGLGLVDTGWDPWMEVGETGPTWWCLWIETVQAGGGVDGGDL